MGLNFTRRISFIFFILGSLWYVKSVSQTCSLIKFNAFPDSLNQKKKDTSICSGSLLDLYASLPVLKKTTSYSISSIAFKDTLPCELTGTVPSGFSAPDNKHSGKIDIGFDFCFFGNSYSKCMISDNGYISFDTLRAGSTSNYYLTSYPPIPNNNYIDYLNSIMGCCMDVFVPLNGSITVQTLGAAPFRVFIVKYIHCAFSGGACPYPANELDMKIALYETTNIIDIYIKKKTLCTGWNSGFAIQGLMDENGVVAYSTTGRNNTTWTAANDAKRFTPSGPNNTFTVKWFNGSAFIGSGYQQTVSPVSDSWYRAELNVDPACGISQTGVTFADSIFVKIKGQSTTINQTNITDTVRCASNYLWLDAGGGIAYRWNSGVKNRYLKVNHSGTYVCQKITDTVNCYFDTVYYNVHSEKVFIDSLQTSGCFSQGLGHLAVYSSGGIGALQYKISNKSYSSARIFDSLSYGSYHVKVKDSIGCEFDSLITIQKPTINIIKRNTCGVDSIGTIVMQVNNFDGPYLFKLDTGSYKTDTFFVNIKGGTHTISVKNSIGCVYDSTFSAPFTSLKLSTSYSIVKASGCAGGTPDGSITITTSGGNPPYRYSLNYSTYKSANIFTGLTEGYYIVSVRDTFNCGIDSVVQVQALAHLYCNAYVINASCFGTATASIIINGFGGVPPYSFSFGGSLFSGINTKTGLGAGTMTVAIKDGRGCVVDSVLPIGQPQPLQFGPTLTNLTCANAANGQIKINGYGGIPPYQFSINGGSFTTSNTFSSLAAGIYALKIKDYNQCVKDTNVTITQPFPLNFQINKTNTSCWNTSDGKFTLTGYSGTSPYQFSFKGGAFSTKNTFDTLAVGSYAVRIKDANNCTRDSVVIISSPPKMSPTIILKTVSCFGNTNGTIKVMVAGGTSPFTFSFNGNPFTSVDSFTNIGASSYNISIVDSRGCRFDTVATVTQPAKLVFNVNIKNVTCFNDSNGEIILSATGGSLPYKYALGSDTFSLNNIFKKMIAGFYVLHIKDANGCIYDTTVKINQPLILRVNISIVNHVSCFNGNNGEMLTNGAGGIPPYRYKLNAGLYSNLTDHPGLVAGSYTISVADSNNCTFDTVVLITQPSKITTLLFITNVTCNAGSDASFKIRASGGKPPYAYAVDTAGFGADSVFLNLKTGVHRAYIKDANNCVVDTLVPISEPAKITSNAVIKNITCYKGNDGKVTLNPVGGTPPYQISTDGLNYNNVLVYSNLIAGNYKYYIRDSRLCTYDTTVSVFQSTLMTNTFYIKNVSCFNSNDGSMSVTTLGGSRPYKYSFNGSPFDTISTFNNLPIGTYTLQTKDTFNCIKDTTVTLTQPPQIYAKVISTDVKCYGASNGTIEISSTGGIPPFTYALDNNSFSTISKYYGLPPNTYRVSVKDNLGCTRDTTVTISQPDSFSFSYAVTKVTCFNGNDGKIEIHVSGATAPYLYAFESQSYSNDTVFNDLKSGLYTFKIKDNNNCVIVRRIFVDQPPKPSLVPDEVVRATWDNDSTVLLQWKKYPKALRYNVESKFKILDIITDTFYYQKLPQTQVYEYQISVVDSCGFLNQKSLTHNTLLLAGNVEDSKIIRLHWNGYHNWQNGVLNYNIYRFNPRNNIFEISWSTPDTSYNILVDPTDTVSEFILYVEAVENLGNTTTSVSNKIYLFTPPLVWMPNVFSPNKDNKNDLLYPQGVGIKSYVLLIYNRWGTLIFKSNDLVRSWDGKYNGVEAPMDSYIYELHALCYVGRNKEEEFFYRGTIQLLR